MKDLSKPISLFHLAVSVLIFVPNCILDPMGIYEQIHNMTAEDTPEPVLMAMRHMSFLCGFFYLLMASVCVCLTYSHDSPKLAMSIIFAYWSFNMVIQILHPWPNPDGIPIPVLDVPIPDAWPFVVLWTILSAVGYSTAPHDLAQRPKEKGA